MESEFITAGLLGIVEGLTEFLPVSSTGHLVLAGKLLSFDGPKAETFEIFIQLGAILAVLLLYWRRFQKFFLLRETSGLSGIPGLIKLGFACFPAALMGLLFHKTIKSLLFAPLPIAAALIVGGIILILFESRLPESRVETLDDISYKQALLTGVCQCFCLWPGVSRSGSMIVGGMVVGFSRVVAAEFSFLVAVPMMFLASGYDLFKSRGILSAADVPTFAIGFIVSFIIAVLAIRFFLGLVKRYSLRPYGIYRIVLGMLVIALM